MTLTRPIQPMPSSVQAALREHGLQDAYASRPRYQRNDYLAWINRAKRDATKQKRLEIMLRELRDGRGYMGLEWQPRIKN